MRIALTALLGSLLTLSPANAAIVSYGFTGVVSFQGYSNYNSPVGSTFSVEFSYDAAVAPTAVFPNVDGSGALYPALLSFSVQFQGVSASYTGASGASVYVQNQSPFSSFANDVFQINVGNSSEITASPVIGLPYMTSMRIYLSDVTSQGLSSSSLPTSFNLADFGDTRVILDSFGIQLQGQLTTLTQVGAVPEPSTWAMMILGFAGVGCMTYRRRKVAALAA
ncbi:PEPxxWA-CTERM sorting domain-containing protein [Bradyrhizobium sp. 190]|uniref:PEPxxWA-CTERM sorting domain-containing protein n=1 Tax=Bradyrhizobium sp. 190 TaxID=2782658 RepID=UPI001FFA24B4|nr:PEPxxWA-CTERM sorting domain-containing protein [Bradyrhizobium sp. 190]